MNKADIRHFIKAQGYTCSYSGNDRIMYVHGGISQERIIYWGINARGIILIAD